MPYLVFKSNISLASYSNYKIGGKAKYFFEPKNIKDLSRAIIKARSEKMPIFILGGGTNILFSDEDFSGLVLKPALKYIKQNGTQLTVGAGLQMSELLNYCLKKSLSGLEWAGGLPGFVGGAVRGNAGAFGGEIKDNILEVVSLDYSGKNPKVLRRANKQCLFGYRDSIFKMRDYDSVIASEAKQSRLLRCSAPRNDMTASATKEIIVEATFALKEGNKKEIKRAIEDKINWRESRQPLDYPNIGSIFKNVDLKLVPKKWQKNNEMKKHFKTDPFPVVPAACLIDKCGLKGVSFGGAMVSQKHPNFIVNCGTATSQDVKTLIKLVKSEVYKKFKVKLEEEVVFV